MISKWIIKNTGSLAGKRVAISGATGGIGNELCFYLASLGASLVLLDRNIEKSRALAERIREKYRGAELSHIKVDMENVNDVKAAADALCELGIDYLILNAGAYSIPRHKCESGYDNVFQINFISPYYLARRLLSGISERGGRVVVVSSIAHGYSESDPGDVDFSERRKAGLVYGNAKRYLTFSLCDSENVVIAHPGISFTGITAHYKKWIYAIIKYPMKLIFMHPKKACLSILFALFTECERAEWIGPRLFDVWGMPKKKRLRSYKKEEADVICAKAEDIFNEFDK